MPAENDYKLFRSTFSMSESLTLVSYCLWTGIPGCWLPLNDGKECIWPTIGAKRDCRSKRVDRCLLAGLGENNKRSNKKRITDIYHNWKEYLFLYPHFQNIITSAAIAQVFHTWVTFYKITIKPINEVWIISRYLWHTSHYIYLSYFYWIT